jgi:hypothetical protein
VIKRRLRTVFHPPQLSFDHATWKLPSSVLAPWIIALSTGGNAHIITRGMARPRVPRIQPCGLTRPGAQLSAISGLLLHTWQARKDLRPNSQALFGRYSGVDVDVE